MKTISMYNMKKTGTVGGLIALGVVLIAFGPLRGAISRHIDPQEFQDASQTPSSISDSFEQLAYEAELMLADMTLIVDWAKGMENKSITKEAYALLFQIDDEFTTPLSIIVVDAWEYGKTGEQYTGYSVEEFWAVYHVLQSKHRSFRLRMSDMLKQLARANDIIVPDYEGKINIFKLDR